MDILVIEAQEKCQLIPQSVHGVLWLQTHFEAKYWEALVSNQVILSKIDSDALSKDAREAGVQVNAETSVPIQS